VIGIVNKEITNPNGVFSEVTCTIGAELIKNPPTLYNTYIFLEINVEKYVQY
jgi:hypothetical protein